MNIALTQSQLRIAPLFDSAKTLVIYETKGYGEELHYIGTFSSEKGGEETIETLLTMDVKVLICGAISSEFEQLLLLHHIDLYSYIAGEVSDVVEGWHTRRLHSRYFSMPGCSEPRHCSHRGQRNRRGCRERARRRDI
ncbi:MAG: hypothetical protein EOM67_04400 [Spirochaetia bacterium]|nr:hypothetical protein [Spirochaetia bacterium]